MHRQDTEQVAFYDVSASFSEDEWELLQEWQKELYGNVMKEIHQALMSLGPLIASTVFSLRAKEKEQLYHKDKRDAKRRHHFYHDPNDTIAHPNVLYRINRKENQYSMNPLDTERKEVNESLNTDLQFLNNDLCLRKEEEPVPIFINHLGVEVCESSPEPKSGHEIISTQIKEEEVASSIDHENINRAEIASGQTGCPIVTSVFSQRFKPKEEAHFQRKPEPVRTNAGVGSKNRNRKKPASYSVVFVDKTTAGKGLHGKAHAEAKILKSFEKGTHSRSQLWPNCNLEPEEGRSVPCESIVMSQKHSNGNQGTSKAKRSDGSGRTDVSRIWNEKLLTGPPSTQSNLRPFACTDCEKTFKMKHHLTRHKRIHTGERPFNCTECGKTFSLKHHLLGHQRTHVMNVRKASVRTGTLFHTREETWE